jgi:hypothetical protein
MKSAHGVIQGYDGVAAVDAKYQVVVHAEAFGEAQEHALLAPMVEGTREHFQAIGAAADIFEQAKLTADAGFHTEKNMQMLFEQDIDGYVADILFRKRDPRFAEAARHKPPQNSKAKAPGLFKPSDFIYDKVSLTCICPAGKRLYRNGRHCVVNGYQAVKFQGAKRDCRNCHLRSRCLKHPERTETRQVYFFAGRAQSALETYTQKMKRKIDSVFGRFIYSWRLATAEPVFANITRTLGLDRFTLRGKRKVNTQWLLYCMVHNIGKVHRYAPGFG